MKITFIVPSLNQRAFIATALDSIAEQRLPADQHEVLVFDGGSTDGTVDVIKQHPVVSYWESLSDRGQGHAVNKGLQMAKGDLIAWLNSDDLYQPGALRVILEAFERNPSADVIYGRSHDIDDNGMFLREFPTRDWCPEALWDSCFISQPAAFFRKNFAQRNGSLREDLHFSLDYEYWLRAATWAKFEYIPKVLANNRVHPSAKSSAQNIRQLKESAWLAYQTSREWRAAWIRRLASAQGRRWLGRVGLSSTPLRPGVSALFYRYYQLRIALGAPVFQYPADAAASTSTEECLPDSRSRRDHPGGH